MDSITLKLISRDSERFWCILIEATLGKRAREIFLNLLRSEGIDEIREIDPQEASWPNPPGVVFDGISVDPLTPEELYITDTTFRDGQQSFRALYTEEARKIFEVLVDLDNGSGRISRSEFFLYTERDRLIVEILRGLGHRYPKIIGWGRASREDVARVREAGLDEMVLLMSISDIHIKYKLGLTRDQAIAKYLDVAEYAMKSGINLRCSLEDVTRSDVPGLVIPLVRRLIRLGERYGVNITIKLPDTTGVGVPYPHATLPYSIPKLVWVLRKIAGLEPEQIEFHGHGDYYMGVANAVAAWIYGASINNATLLGIGERAGNVPIEALVMIYARLKGDFGGMNPLAIGRAAGVFKELGYEVPRYQPIVGENAFSTMAGIHIDAQMKNPATYLSFDPGIIGREPRILIGPYSGTSGVAYWINRKLGIGVEKNSELVKRIYERIVKRYSNGAREPLRDEEIREIVLEELARLSVTGLQTYSYKDQR
ncbi:pyruvate carboxyltransferase [Desulfurococcaceae archaeon AG1]|jgi:isopropylmalate/homocitrate/citramalate synthase|nr:pyruvate carboxyltransferase [Desulfurococcaceae archaeon AG1]